MIELLVAATFGTVVFLITAQTFFYIARSINNSGNINAATNLAREKLENFNQISYYRVMVTTDTLHAPAVCPEINMYDEGYYPPEKIYFANTRQFECRYLIRKARENPFGQVEYLDWQHPDSGLKEIIVYVIWQNEGVWDHVRLSIFKQNPDRTPQNSEFTGRVCRHGTTLGIENATVVAVQNPSFEAVTDSLGDYHLSTYDGEYSLRASAPGYFSFTKPKQLINGTQIISGQDFFLVVKDSGTISGNAAFPCDHLLISQIVGDAGNGQEYLELYNPTSYYWEITDSAIDIIFYDRDNLHDTEININFGTATPILPSHSYYLIANQTIVVVPALGGLSVNADAVYSASGEDIIKTSGNQDGGGIMLTNDDRTVVYDKVAWTKNSGNTLNSPAIAAETDPVRIDNFEDEEQLVRSSVDFDIIGDFSDGSSSWDSNINSSDFNRGAAPQDHIIAYPPKNTFISFAPSHYPPAQGALVFADDGLSAITTADSNGDFNLTNVATGTWTVIVSSGLLQSSTWYYGGFANNYSTTTPNMILTDTVIDGYISGIVLDSLGNPLRDIIVDARGAQNITNDNGRYFIISPLGTFDLTANFDNGNPIYEEKKQLVNVSQGMMTFSDFSLSQAGKLCVWVTSNGVDPLPQIPISAFSGGTEIASSLSGPDGYAAFENLTVGTYNLYPQLNSEESSTPDSIIGAAVMSGVTTDAGTFTVLNTAGRITGDLSVGAGHPIKSGVLICATPAPNTIASDPPDINDSLRRGAVLYFNTTGQLNGRYRINVIGGSDYNIYAWYTRWVNGAASITRKSATNVPVLVGEDTVVNFDW